MSEPKKPDQLPAGATPEGDGIAVGDGPVRVDMYIDFLCPFCQRFELNAAGALAALAGNHQATLVYHPMNFLDEASTTHYSTRAAAASGCAADQGQFLAYAHELFVNQPPEGGPGLSDAELAAIGRAVALDDAAFGTCLDEAPYLDWPSYVTARANELGVQGTPTVLVAGTMVRPDARTITAAVAAAHSRP